MKRHMRRTLNILSTIAAVAAIAAGIHGCASRAGDVRIAPAGAAAPGSAARADSAGPAAGGANGPKVMSGQGQVLADASGWTGIVHNTNVSLAMTLLMAFFILMQLAQNWQLMRLVKHLAQMSHERELKRITPAPTFNP